MKPIFKIMNLKKFLFLPLIIFALMESCQTEETEITNPPEEEIIEANSTIANLMSKTTSNDGSIDNILDYANCLEVVLPVTITANGVSITIEGYTDFEALEALLEAFANDNDEVVFTFPITVTLNDYTELVINNQAELDAQIELCNGENEDDDDIECIDFQYPINISIYDSNFQVIDIAVVEDDETLFNFINDLEGGVLASLNFPITMILSDGNTVIVNNNQELEVAISDAEGSCDEDDDYDYMDDSDCTEASVLLALVECNWNIVDYNGSDDLIVWNIHFQSNGIFVYGFNNIFSEGEWSLTETTDGTMLEFYNLVEGNENIQVIAGNWLLVQCNGDRFELTMDDQTMVLEQDCTPDFSGCIDSEIIICDVDVIDGFAEFNLNSAGCVLPAIYGISFYETEANATNNVTTIATPESYMNIIQSTQVIYARIFSTMNSNSFEIYPITLIVEDCDSPFNCFQQEEYSKFGCDYNNDGYIEFYLDISEEASGCDLVNEFNISYHTSQVDADTGVNAITVVEPFENTMNLTVVYVRAVYISTGEYQIFPITLTLSPNCPNFNCVELDIVSNLETCKWVITDYTSYGSSTAYSSYAITFNANGTLIIQSSDGLEATGGSWSTQSSGGYVYITFSGISIANIMFLNDTYKFIECENGSHFELEENLNFNNVLTLDEDCN